MKIFFIMPAIAAIAAGLGLMGSGINSAGQWNANRQNRNFQREMYDRQWRDNMYLWNQTNAYNSPAAQMRRFQEAGLNPMLMYSQGQPGQAPALKSPDTSPPEIRNPEWGNALTGALPMLSAIQDFDIKQAQTDNLASQNTVLEQDAELRRAQTEQTRAATNRLLFDLGLDEEFRGTSAEMRTETLRQLKNNIDLATKKDAREAVALSSSVAEAADRMKTAYQQRLSAQIGRTKTAAEIYNLREEYKRIQENIENLKKDGTLKDLEIKMRAKNMSYNDPLWSRILAPILEKLVLEGGDYLKKPFSAGGFGGEIKKADTFLQNFLVPPGLRKK